MSTRQKHARNKGDLTKARIINAALDIISDKGFSALSHRNIAKEAGVQLASTSYYFGSLDQLILEAFEYFIEKELRYLEEAERQFQIDSIASIEELSEKFAELIIQNVTTRSWVQSIDFQFLYNRHLPEAVRSRVLEFDKVMKGLIAKRLEAFGSLNPDEDAAILLAILRSHEFRGICDPEHFDQGALRNQVYRLMSCLVGQPKSPPPQ